MMRKGNPNESEWKQSPEYNGISPAGQLCPRRISGRIFRTAERHAELSGRESPGSTGTKCRRLYSRCGRLSSSADCRTIRISTVFQHTEQSKCSGRERLSSCRKQLRCPDRLSAGRKQSGHAAGISGGILRPAAGPVSGESCHSRISGRQSPVFHAGKWWKLYPADPLQSGIYHSGIRTAGAEQPVSARIQCIHPDGTRTAKYNSAGKLQQSDAAERRRLCAAARSCTPPPV